MLNIIAWVILVGLGGLALIRFWPFVLIAFLCVGAWDTATSAPANWARHSVHITQRVSGYEEHWLVGYHVENDSSYAVTNLKFTCDGYKDTIVNTAYIAPHTRVDGHLPINYVDSVTSESIPADSCKASYEMSDKY